MKPEEASRLLQAYVDGELDPAASLELEAEFAANPALRAAHQRMRAMSAAIREKADYHAAPAGLAARIAGSLPSAPAIPGARGSRWRIAAFAAAGIAALAVAALLVLAPAQNRLMEDVLASHARATLGQRMIDVASSDQHTVKPWLSARLPFSPPVADFAPQGFPLAGARVDYAGGRPVAVLVYQRRKHTIEVFVWPAAGEAAARSDSRDGLNLESFARNGMRYWLVSDLGREELGELARLF